MSDHANVQQALAAVMADVQSVGKTEKNQQQGFSFRGIDAVLNAVGPALRKHGVVVMPTVLEHTYGSVEVGRNRTPMAHVTVKVTYTFYGPDSTALAATVIGEAMDSGDKAVAKAMSVAFRIALLQALALPTDEPDPDADTYERSPVTSVTDSVFKSLSLIITDAKTVDDLDLAAARLREYDLTDKMRADLAALYSRQKKIVTS